MEGWLVLLIVSTCIAAAYYAGINLGRGLYRHTSRRILSSICASEMYFFVFGFTWLLLAGSMFQSAMQRGDSDGFGLMYIVTLAQFAPLILLAIVAGLMFLIRAIRRMPPASHVPTTKSLVGLVALSVSLFPLALFAILI